MPPPTQYDESTVDDNLLDLPLDMDNIFRTLQSVGYHIMVTGKDGRLSAQAHHRTHGRPHADRAGPSGHP